MAGGSGQAGQHTREEKTRGIEGTEKSIAPPGGLKLRCNGGGKHEKRYEPHSKSVRQPAAGAVAGVEPAPTRAGQHTREEKTRGIEGTEKSIAPPGGLKLRCNGGGKHEK